MFRRMLTLVALLSLLALSTPPATPVPDIDPFEEEEIDDLFARLEHGDDDDDDESSPAPDGCPSTTS